MDIDERFKTVLRFVKNCKVEECLVAMSTIESCDANSITENILYRLNFKILSHCSSSDDRYFPVLAPPPKESTLNCGKVAERFPQNDWEDVPFTEGIEMFCQPCGWSLLSEESEPTYFASVLTDIEADRHYLLCLTFYEHVSCIRGSEAYPGRREEFEGAYAPKCIVLISQNAYFDVFKEILFKIYAECSNSPSSMKSNTVQTSFSIDDFVSRLVTSHSLSLRSISDHDFSNQPTLSAIIVSMFKQLGHYNVIFLLFNLLTDAKVLLYSNSYNRLTLFSHSLTTLIYPFKYTNVFIPVLPINLIDVIHAPTPYIIGAHTSLIQDLDETPDAIIVNIDSGHLEDSFHSTKLNLFSLELLNFLYLALNHILNPEILRADHLFTRSAAPSSPTSALSRDVCHVFMSFFSYILKDYTFYLTVCRIFPETVIFFDRSAFLTSRKPSLVDFTSRLMDSMCFQSFISERCIPYRSCDIFDLVYSSNCGNLFNKMYSSNEFTEQVALTLKNISTMSSRVIKHSTQAHKLFHSIHEFSSYAKDNDFLLFDCKQYLLGNELNEFSYSQTAIRINAERLNDRIACLLTVCDEVLSSSSSSTHLSLNSLEESTMHLFNCTGVRNEQSVSNGAEVARNTKRVNVLKICCAHIFNKEIVDAIKILPSLLRSLKFEGNRLAVCEELKYYCIEKKFCLLNNQQFSLITRLINTALQYDASSEEHKVAYIVLPLSASFYRKLSTGVIQFVYTCIQEHPVWLSLSFWEKAYYRDIQSQIICFHSAALSAEYGNNSGEEGALSFTASLLSKSNTFTEKFKKKLIEGEESALFSLAIHYLNQICYLTMSMAFSENSTPFSTSTLLHQNREQRVPTSSFVTSNDSESVDVESGFSEICEDENEEKTGVCRFLLKFTDKIANQVKMNDNHELCLRQMIPEIFAMHKEFLESIYKVIQVVPWLEKPKIVFPELLPNEVFLLPALRSYLIIHHCYNDILLMLSSLLPASGLIFLTNYRIIFRGIPCDAFASNYSILTYFPISTFNCIKKISANSPLFSSPKNQDFYRVLQRIQHEVWQIESSSFHTIGVAFEKDVSPDSFFRYLHKLRYPESHLHFYAFTFSASSLSSTLVKKKEKFSSLKPLKKKNTHSAILSKMAKKSTNTFRVLTVANKSKNAKTETSAIGAFFKHQFKISHNSQKPFSNKTTNLINNNNNTSTSNSLSENESFLEEEEENSGDISYPSVLLHSSLSNIDICKTQDAFSSSLVYKDYARLKIVSNTNIATPASTGIAPSTTPYTINTSKGCHGDGKATFKLCYCNVKYGVCKTYPAYFYLPQAFVDSNVSKLASCHKNARFAVITWRHKQTKSLLLRSSTFYNKNVVKVIKSQRKSAASTSLHFCTLLNSEYLKYMQCIIDIMPRSGNHTMLTNDFSVTTTNNTPIIPNCSSNNRVSFMESVSLHKAFHTLKNLNYSTTSKSMTLNDKEKYMSASNDDKSVSPSSTTFSSSLLVNKKDEDSFKMYILSDVKLQIRQAKYANDNLASHIKFITLKYPSSHEIKNAFKKLIYACNEIGATSKISFAQRIEESNWLGILRDLLKICASLSKTVSEKAASVLIAIEDGTSLTPVLTSVIQLLCDPFYRTFTGFRTLIEKEWMAFGYKFSYRYNQLSHFQDKLIAPYFLLFLDLVNHLLTNSAHLFQFNSFYLEFLAYHHASNRFNNFCFDCERERVEFESISFCEASSNSNQKLCSNVINEIKCVWQYVDFYNNKAPHLFYNPYFCEMTNHVNHFKPDIHAISFSVWSFYLTRSLNHSFVYDFELVLQDNQYDTSNFTNKSLSSRLSLNPLYQNTSISFSLGTSFHYLLFNIQRYQGENAAFSPHHVSSSKHQSKHESDLSKSIMIYKNYIHCKYRLFEECFLAFGTSNDADRSSNLTKYPLYEHEFDNYLVCHNFEKMSFAKPAFCNVCYGVIWGLSKNSGMHCSTCKNYNVHVHCMSKANNDTCIPSAPNNATAKTVKKHQLTFSEASSLCLSSSNNSCANTSGVGTLKTVKDADVSSSPPFENSACLFQGYLYKRGALLKTWKQRWFVLDYLYHHLRYYDNPGDGMQNFKGVIDLKEVLAVNISPNPTFLHRGAVGLENYELSNSSFEIKTPRKVFTLLANNPYTAKEWVDKIQSCLQ